jgi:hypothetical protein
MLSNFYVMMLTNLVLNGYHFRHIQLHPFFFFPRSATRSGCPTLAFSEMASHPTAATFDSLNSAGICNYNGMADGSGDCIPR